MAHTRLRTKLNNILVISSHGGLPVISPAHDINPPEVESQGEYDMSARTPHTMTEEISVKIEGCLSAPFLIDPKEGILSSVPAGNDCQ